MESRLREVKDITEQVMKVFSKFYVAALKEVVVEDIKERRYHIAKQQLIEEKNAGKPPKPRRPRKETEKNTRLTAKIGYSYEMDSGIDGFIVYAVTAEYGDERVTSYKRYKQFKKFHSKYGGKVKTAKLPPPSSSWGSRDLSWEFRRFREKALQEYVEAICNEPKSAQNKDVLSFFRVGQNEDRIFRETFERAYRRTRVYFWQWSWVCYESEEEAMGRLVSEIVKDRMWYDITSGLPSNETVRRKAMQAAWKAIQATVQPAVAAGWKVVRGVVEKLKPVVVTTLESALDPFLKAQEEIKQKISDILRAALEPVSDALKGLVKPLFADAILPQVAEAIFSVCSAEKFMGYLHELDSIVATEDVDKMKAIQKEVAEVRLNVIKKVDESLEKALEPIVGDFKSKVSIQSLGGIFSPVSKMNALAKHFFEFLDPSNQFHVMEELFKWKKQIKEAGKEKVEEMLDREEWDIENWPVWRCVRNIRYSGWYAAWNMYTLLPEANSAVRQFEHFVEEFAHLNHVAFHKKFSWKFGDYLHEAAKTANTPEEFRAAVDQTFMIGYKRFTKYYHKHFNWILAKHVKKMVAALVFDKLEKELVEGAKEAIEPLASAIPSPLDNLIDVYSMTTEVITENLDRLLEEAVGAIHPLLHHALHQMKALEPTRQQIWSVVLPPITEEPKPASPPSSPKADRSP